MIVDDPGNREHDLDVPSHHDPDGRLSGDGPAGGSLGKMQYPSVPGLVDKVHAEERQPRIDGVPVSREPRSFNFPGIDLKHHGQQGDEC